MHEALKGFRDTLAKDVAEYEESLAAMRDGRENIIHRRDGVLVDITDARIKNYEDIIRNLQVVIRDIDLKVGNS